jgi:hypothetical protein
MNSNPRILRLAFAALIWANFAHCAVEHPLRMPLGTGSVAASNVELPVPAAATCPHFGCICQGAVLLGSVSVPSDESGGARHYEMPFTWNWTIPILAEDGHLSAAPESICQGIIARPLDRCALQQSFQI